MSNFVPEKTALGIEFGSTRIKAVLIGPEHTPLAQGDYTWENQLHNGIWTYPLEQVWQGLQSAYAALAADVQQKYGCTLTKVGCIGISAMMHGYLAFDANGELLVPFRTWRNTITGAAAEELTAAFGFNIPQRWSIAHLYQAMLNKEEHLSKLDFFTTLAGYVHWQLTGHKVLGVGDASGMFPIDSTTGGYDAAMLQKFNTMAAAKGYAVDLNALLPEVLPAGADAGTLTEAGARLLDPAGNLQAGIPLCPPEGDAGTGMAATNSVAPRTGNVSAGTSIFAMVVLEKALSKVYPEIDMVTTPAGDPVAMVHCNNCTSDLNAWVELLAQNAELCGAKVNKSELFTKLFNLSLQGAPDCGGVIPVNYYSGEGVTHFDAGRPMLLRKPDARQHLLRVCHAGHRVGYPERRTCDAGYPAGPRRPVQDPRRGPALPGRCRPHRCDLHRNRRRGRPLRHGPAGCLPCGARRWRNAGKLPAEPRVRRCRQHHPEPGCR